MTIRFELHFALFFKYFSEKIHSFRAEELFVFYTIKFCGSKFFLNFC